MPRISFNIISPRVAAAFAFKYSQGDNPRHTDDEWVKLKLMETIRGTVADAEFEQERSVIKRKSAADVVEA